MYDWWSNVRPHEKDAQTGSLRYYDPVVETPYGKLFNCDCNTFAEQVHEGVVDTVFVDPPFNVGKDYGFCGEEKKIDDSMKEDAYNRWVESWLRECVRMLKPGGTLFYYNISRWTIPHGAFLMYSLGMSLRHAITVNINGQMPVPGRLMQQGYSLLYLVKGERPSTFHPIRTPVKYCRNRNCKVKGNLKVNEQGQPDPEGKLRRPVVWHTTRKDYGGYRQRYEQQHGIMLSDVWEDITAVRHDKFKIRDANQLSTKILERCIQISTHPGDVVVDLFGGAGTTFAVAERLGRRWLGSELSPEFCGVIRDRLAAGGGEFHPNEDTIIRDDCPACKAMGLKTEYPPLPEWYENTLFTPVGEVCDDEEGEDGDEVENPEGDVFEGLFKG